MPLQAGSGQVRGGVAQWPVEIAAPDQDQVHEIAREFQEQPIGRIELPLSQPAIGEPRAVAILEADFDCIGTLADTSDSQMRSRKPHRPRHPFLCFVDAG